LQARETRITAIETADATQIQAIGAAQTTYVNAESGAHVILDNAYTTNAKTWNAGAAISLFHKTAKPFFSFLFLI
jgi:hypothetical protein